MHFTKLLDAIVDASSAVDADAADGIASTNANDDVRAAAQCPICRGCLGIGPVASSFDPSASNTCERPLGDRLIISNPSLTVLHQTPP